MRVVPRETTTRFGIIPARASEYSGRKTFGNCAETRSLSGKSSLFNSAVMINDDGLIARRHCHSHVETTEIKGAAALGQIDLFPSASRNRADTR